MDVEQGIDVMVVGIDLSEENDKVDLEQEQNELVENQVEVGNSKIPVVVHKSNNIEWHLPTIYQLLTLQEHHLSYILVHCNKESHLISFHCT